MASDNPPDAAAKPTLLLTRFLIESNAIERIYREPTEEEVDASARFLDLPKLGLEAICAVQAVYAPGEPLRTRRGMDVRLDGFIPPPGGLAISGALGNIAARVSAGADPWAMHIEFETLHPFRDGNGRTGRILWAWNMQRVMQNPFAIDFLHRWYYQTLAGVRRESDTKK